MTYYFPLLFVIPSFSSEQLEHPPFRLARRLRSTSIFDLATLAVKHQLKLPFQFMDVFLSKCNLELAVDASSLDVASTLLSQFRLGLYLGRITPFLIPFATSHSFNEYSGINARDSPLLVEKLSVEEREGIKSTDAQVEAWHLEFSLHCIKLPGAMGISDRAFHQACDRAAKWQSLEAARKELIAFRTAVEAAPTLSSLGQSVLHMWCGLEALFPKVSTEVSFRLSLYLAQLVGGAPNRREYFGRYRHSYDLRSKIAHGMRGEINDQLWEETWELLIAAGEAILARGALPAEESLLEELLEPPRENAS